MFLVLLLLLVSREGAASGDALQESQETAASHFFHSLDGNNDGEIDEQEARKFIGETFVGTEFDTSQKVDAAVDRMKSNVDGADPYATISKEELQQHLQRLMQGGSVAEWVRHGLGLPHLENVFKKNRITALDFPLLLEDGGAVLSKEMQVSKLQKAQIIRGLQFLILGLGELPPNPEECSCSEIDCNVVSLDWKLASSGTNPPVHKYVIEKQSTLPGSGWEEVHELDIVDGQQNQFHVRIPIDQGQNLFRIVAWSAYGRSEKVKVMKCLPPEHTTPCSTFEDKVLSSSWTQVFMKSSEHQNAGTAITNIHGDHTPSHSLAGFSTVIVLLLTVAIRFFHSRHISCARFLTVCGLSSVAKILHLKHSDTVSPAHSSQESPQRSLKHSKWRASIGSDMGKSSRGLDSFNSYSSSRPDSPGISQPDGELRNFLNSFGQGGNYPYHGVWSKSGSEEWAEAASATASWEASQSQEDGNNAELDYQHSELIVGQCSYDGCKAHWRGLRQLRKRLYRHFCGICQLSYCSNHTRICAHGPLNSCGQQSRCVCISCFESLLPERQKQLERTHRQSSGHHWGSRSEQNSSSKQRRCLSHRTSKLNEASRSRALRNWARASWKVRAVCNFKQAGREVAKRRQREVSGDRHGSDVEH